MHEFWYLVSPSGFVISTEDGEIFESSFFGGFWQFLLILEIMEPTICELKCSFREQARG